MNAKRRAKKNKLKREYRGKLKRGDLMIRDMLEFTAKFLGINEKRRYMAPDWPAIRRMCDIAIKPRKIR